MGKRKPTPHKPPQQGMQETLLAERVPAAVEKLAALMEQNESIETARKACVDVLKLHAEQQIQRTASDSEPMDPELAQRLLNALAAEEHS
jgi:hypothetical protein